ncbi:hypothetical protein SEVIR_2G196650v4 [Setaria viridis]
MSPASSTAAAGLGGRDAARRVHLPRPVLSRRARRGTMRTACQPGEGTDEGVAVAGRPAGLALLLRTIDGATAAAPQDAEQRAPREATRQPSVTPAAARLLSASRPND